MLWCLYCSESDCSSKLTTCFETVKPSGPVATDIDGVCDCFQSYSNCYIAGKCYGLVPSPAYNYCFEELKCSRTQCAGNSGALTIVVSTAVALTSLIAVLWLARGPIQ